MKNTIVSENRGYGNIEVYSPNDVLMFYTNLHRLKFYLKKDLAEKIDDGKYRLKFVPNGLGYAENNNSFDNKLCLIPRENKCVVSGEENLSKLSKHHIVPSFFRKHFPIELKSSFQTIVLLRRDIHSQYTVQEQAFYDVLAEKYGVPSYSTFQLKTITKREQKLAHSLYHYGHIMPIETKLQLQQEFRNQTGQDATLENLEKCSTLALVNKRDCTVENNFGAAIVDKVTDFREFEMLWLNHFIEHAKPKYLPEDLIKAYHLDIV